MEAKDNKIVMDVQDAIDLYRYIAELEAENRALRDGLERERQATKQYINQASELIDKYEQERKAWNELERQMNSELREQKMKGYKHSVITFILGGAIGAIIAD